MKLPDSPNNTTGGFIIIILKLMLYVSLFITPILLYMISATSVLFIFITLIGLYPLFNIIMGYPLLDLSLHNNNMKFIPISAIIFSLFNMPLSIYLWFGRNPIFINFSLRRLNDFTGYITPYLVAFTILLVCKSLHTEPFFKKPLIFFLFAMVLFLFQLFSNLTYFIHYINLSMVTILFIRFLYLVRQNETVINRSSYTYVQILFNVTLFNGTISLLDKYYKLPILYIVLILFSAYILATISLQHYLIQSFLSLSTKELLYNKNIDLMNRFLTLKTLEAQNLETEILIKDNVYKQLFDFAPDAFAICTGNTISYSNTAFKTLLEVEDKAELLNKSLWNFIHPDSLDTARSCSNDLLSRKKDTCTAELQLLSLNNNIKVVRVSSSITFIENDFYIFCSFHDLTTYYEQERLKSQLESDIAQEKFKVEFFANISHDLKTPINVIYSAVQLQDIYTLSSEYDKVLVYNNIIKQNCLRLQKLLNDILDITKIDANYFKPQPLLCNIISTIETITESIISYVDNKNISIIFDTNVEDKFVMTDPNLIERIILNLISNAIKYGQQNGHVWVTLFDEGDHLIINVKDDGIGIPKSHISKIFNRFHKPESNSDANISGNGIGLSLVKSIVEMLEGTIFCISTEGIGSEFIVILPMASKNIDEFSHSECATSLDLGNNLNIELSDI